MIKLAMYTTILTLHKQGVSQRQIAKITKSDRKTIKKIVDRYLQENIESPAVYQRESILTSWHQEIVDLLASNLSLIRIHETLLSKGCHANYSSLTAYVRKHNIKKDTCIRFHTPPGEEAQVDFGDIGLQYDPSGKRRKAYVFNMRLSYSRLDYYEIVFDQKCETWIRCHINAFKFFGGAPGVIKLDNLKAGVLNNNFYEPTYQKEYKRLADHYNLLLSPCRPYQPQEKGKVESGIKYVKNNFFAGRKFNNYGENCYQLTSWINKANTRIHGTTKEKPQELFEQFECESLSSLPLTEFDFSTWHTRKVARDCHITIDNNYYSVPSKYVSEEVTVRLSHNLVEVFFKQDEVITTHVRSQGKGVFTTTASHYALGKRFCPGFAEYDDKCQLDLTKMGKNCEAMLTFVRQQHKKDWHRIVKGILSLRKHYSDAVIDQACARAMHYGIASYSHVKSILENNAISLPLPEYGEVDAKFA